MHYQHLLNVLPYWLEGTHDLHNSDNPRQLCNYINITLHRKAYVALPSHDSTNSLCKSISKHFEDNITQIHSSFPDCASNCSTDFTVVHHPCTVFKPLSLIEITKFILSSSNKSNELDPILTYLLNSYLHTLTVPIAKIKLSLSSGMFPSYFKHTHVNPLLINHLYQSMTQTAIKICLIYLEY